MKRTNVFTHLSKVFAVTSILISCTWATTHIVKFGGSAGFKYVPASLSAAVDDTVRWEGDFSVHPLSSTVIPAGSESWHVSSGNTFSYVITIPGTYKYRCDLHTDMTGEFQADMTGISHPGPHFGTQTTAAVMHIISLNGRKRATLPYRITQVGSFSQSSAGKPAADGIYFIKVKYNDKKRVVKFLSVQ
jgi:plastocyanin